MKYYLRVYNYRQKIIVPDRIKVIIENTENAWLKKVTNILELNAGKVNMWALETNSVAISNVTRKKFLAGPNEGHKFSGGPLEKWLVHIL